MMTVPTFDVLMQSTMNALHALGGSASGTEIAHHVIRELDLPAEIVSELHGNGDARSHLSWNTG